MGEKVVAAARALGILVSIWAVVIGVAYVTDSLPDAGSEPTEAEPDPERTPEEPEEPEPEPTTPDVEEPPAATPSEPNAPAEPTIEAPEPATAPRGGTVGPRRHTKVCEDVEHARIGVGSILGDPRPEQIVVCDREAHVLTVHGGELARLATLTLEGEAQVKMASPAVADVDGDGLSDLVLGWTELDAEGGPKGGTLRWVAGDPSGGFGTDHVLHPLSVIALQTAELDGRTGTDVVAIHWADGFGRRPSEAWVFGGGPSPRRIARRRLRNDGVAAALADVNGDGDLDLITIDAEGAQIADGDGTGRFPRFRSIVLEAGRDIVVVPAAPAPARSEGDDEANGETDGEANGATQPDTVYLIGQEVTKLDPAGEPTTVPAPHGILRALALPDGDLLAMTRQRVARLEDGSEETVIDLPGTFRPTDMALVSGEDAPVVLVLGRTADGWELLEAPLGANRVRLEPGAEPGAVVDAPLVLNLTLR